MLLIPISFYSIVAIWFVNCYVKGLSFFHWISIPTLMFLSLCTIDWLISLHSTYNYKKDMKKYIEIQKSINSRLSEDGFYIKRIFFPCEIFRIFSADGNFIKQIDLDCMPEVQVNVDSVDEMVDFILDIVENKNEDV